MIDAASVLPARSDEDILAGRVRLILGGQPFDLPVLTIAANREFKAALLRRGFELLDLLDEKTELGALMRRLAQGTNDQLDCLAWFDERAQLPSREWIEANATEDELWAATKAVIAAAFPFVDGLRQAIPTLVNLIRTLQGVFTSSSQPTTAGRRGLFRRN